MTDTTRRRALRLTVAGLGVALAGCVDGPGSGDPGTPGGSPDERSPDEDPNGDGSPRFETLRLPPSTTRPDWHADDQTGRVVLMDDEDRWRAVVGPLDLDGERQEALRAFYDETDFEESVVALVQTAAPNACYSGLDVTGLSVRERQFVGEATAVRPDAGDVGCAQVVTYPAALVRATVDGDPPTEATFTVTDGWGDAAEVSATVDDPLGPVPDDLPGYVRPDGDPPAVRDPLVCDREGARRLDSWVDDPPWGETQPGDDDGLDGAFALRVDPVTAELGDVVTVRLTNVGDAVQYTGNRNKYGVQALTEDGWQDVRVATGGDPVAYTDEAIGHYPGEGFEWTFELTEEGLLGDHVHADRLDVCPDLAPGHYRFVFWEPAAAVAFDVVE